MYDIIMEVVGNPEFAPLGENGKIIPNPLVLVRLQKAIADSGPVDLARFINDTGIASEFIAKGIAATLAEKCIQQFANQLPDTRQSSYLALCDSLLLSFLVGIAVQQQTTPSSPDAIYKQVPVLPNVTSTDLERLVESSETNTVDELIMEWRKFILINNAGLSEVIAKLGASMALRMTSALGPGRIAAVVTPEMIGMAISDAMVLLYGLLFSKMENSKVAEMLGEVNL